MAGYLNPKNDLTFKRIFGEHPHLLISFLNSLLPLGPARLIESLEYLSPEQIPDTPLKRNSIVDVRCKDNFGRHFIVEMQMYWSAVFYNRMQFNTSKAYVRQLDKGEHYDELQTVYGLGIVNQTFGKASANYYHHYQTVNVLDSDDVIKGIEIVLIDLSKFKPKRPSDRRMAVLWLRFLKEMNEAVVEIPEGLADNALIGEALEICRESAFTPAELEAYDRYWDYVRTEAGLYSYALKEGEAKGKMEGEAKGKMEGEAKGRMEEKRATIFSCHKAGVPIATIAAATRLSSEEITEILKNP